jgi:CBS domain containing-hemolysin-like protein
VLTAIGNLDYYVAASQLGITLATIALGFLGEPVIAALIEPPIEELVGSFAPAISHTVALAVAFLFVTTLHIVLGEFVPKTIALQRPTSTTLWLAMPLSVFTWIFGPAISALNAIAFGALRLLGMEVRPIGDQPLAVEELALSLESSASAGLISRRELDLARNTLSLASLTVDELMLPRNEVIGIPVDATRREVFDIFAASRHTRYPVYRTSLDDIVGILNAKELVLDWSDEGTDWRHHVQPPLILPETVTIEQAVSAARAEAATMIALADEFGGTAGIISVFDIVEFLAGDLPDEFDTEPPDYRELADGSLLVSGLEHLIDLETAFDLELPDVEAHTIGGLVTELLQRIPDEGDEVRIDGYVARVTAMDGLRVDQVLLTPIDSDREGGAE